MSKLRKQQGFSLVEIAIVLLIMGLLVSGSMTLFKSQKDSVAYKESSNKLNFIKEVMLGFVVINNYIPCPDTNAKGSDGYGEENRTAGRCTAFTGGVPFLDLGLNEADVTDAKYNPVRYYVNQGVTTLTNIQASTHSASYFCNQDCAATIPEPLPVFTAKTPPTAELLGAGNYMICARSNQTCTASSEMEFENLPIVLVADNIKGAGNCSAQGTAEKQNCDGDLIFWQGNFSMTDERAFDDYVVGLSGYEIKTKMLMNNPRSLK